jgi:hypothetical protein
MKKFSLTLIQVLNLILKTKTKKNNILPKERILVEHQGTKMLPQVATILPTLPMITITLSIHL